MLKQPLYQVHVETRAGELIPVGPKMLKFAADMLATSIKEQVTSGREKSWGNPHLKLCLF